MAKAKVRMLFDKTEIIVSYKDGNSHLTENLQYSDITTIRIDKCTEGALFFKKPSERIEILTRKREVPFTYFKLAEQPYFEDYKQKLTEFAKTHKITLHDSTKD